jgi:hypothetical protein
MANGHFRPFASQPSSSIDLVKSKSFDAKATHFLRSLDRKPMCR